MENRPTHEEFSRHLNQTFLLQIEGAEPFPLQLVEVSELRVTPRQEMFSILFRSQSQNIFPQQIYTLENETMGQIKLFLVPVGKDEESVSYEAIFNRVVNQS